MYSAKGKVQFLINWFFSNHFKNHCPQKTTNTPPLPQMTIFIFFLGWG